MDKNMLWKKIDELFQVHDYDLLEETLSLYKDISQQDNGLAAVYYLMYIYRMEKESGEKTILEKVNSIHELLERYIILKFYFRRIDFGLIDGGMGDFYQYILQNQVSSYELLTIMDYSVVHKNEVFEIIREILQEIAQ